MKDYKQTADSVLKRVHEYEHLEEQKHAKVRIIGKWSAIAVPVLAIAAVGTFALINSSGGKDISTADDTSINDTIAAGVKQTDSSTGSSVFCGDYCVPDSSESNAEVTAVTSESEVKASSSSSSESKADSSSSELDDSLNPNKREGGQVMIAAIPNNNKTKVTGEKITDEEARDYFNKNSASLASSLTASGVELAEVYYEADYDGTQVICAKDSLVIRKGYCHISYDGSVPPTGFKTDSPEYSEPGLTLKQNFMDFHVYNAGRLVAIVTLVKENGLITATPAFGASWFGSFDKALRKYSGQKVLFLYAGAMAFAIAPDGKVIHPQGYENSVKDSGLDKFPNAYQWFYNEQCVYTP